MATKKPTAKKKKVGRRSVFPTLDVDQIRTLAERGFTDKEIAAFFKVNESTFHDWKRQFPKFQELLLTAKGVANARVEEALFGRAVGVVVEETSEMTDGVGLPSTKRTIKQLPPDPTSMIFWLKNRDPNRWKDKQDVELSGNVTLGDAILKARQRAKSTTEGEADA